MRALFGMPELPFSSQEKMQHLMAGRNLWKLYRRKCDATKEDIISAYPPDSPFTVYKNKVWWGDTWSALDYGQDIDFNRPFFEQLRELQLKVPREGTSVFESENCEYNSHVRFSKNSYLNSLAVRIEDVHYSHWMVDVENSIDCCFHITGKSSLCYECGDFGTCYNCTNLWECYNCNDCHFSYQLRGCKNCLFCNNLSNKEYHIRNKLCSKEEFEKEKAKFINGSYSGWKAGLAEAEKVRMSALHRGSFLLNSENVTGDHLFSSRNCVNCFDGDNSEDCSNSVSLNDSKDIHTCYSAGWPRCEQLYCCIASRGCSEMAFTHYMWTSNNMFYSDSCQSCKYGIGCIGLKHKDYCILNKQYSKEEYSTLSKKLIEHMKKTGEWGNFMPQEMYPFAYNESAAQEYFPLEKKDATALGYRWRDIVETPPEAKKVIKAAQLPDRISEIPDEVLDWAISCEVTGRPFKIIKQELDFYRRMNLPLPRIHPQERNRLRMVHRNPYKLWKRACAECKKEIESSYAPERKERVVCEECYLKKVY